MTEKYKYKLEMLLTGLHMKDIEALLELSGNDLFLLGSLYYNVVSDLLDVSKKNQLGI